MADELKQGSFLDPLGRRQQARWIAAAAKRDAEKAAWFGRPAEDVAADMARLEDLLFTRAKWKFASTMADNPHSYTLRRQWARDWPTGNDDFVWTVQTIRIIADREKFPERGPFARWYTVLHLNGAKFWPMNFPVDWPSGRWCTILINRKPPFLPGDHR
jgi:hypothetical protein